MLVVRYCQYSIYIYTRCAYLLKGEKEALYLFKNNKIKYRNI